VTLVLLDNRHSGPHVNESRRLKRAAVPSNVQQIGQLIEDKLIEVRTIASAVVLASIAYGRQFWTCSGKLRHVVVLYNAL